MTRLTDGTRTVEISMMYWKEATLTPDFSNDFFNVGWLEESDCGDCTYIVEDVNYFIEQAEEWKNRTGDFIGDAEIEDGERVIFVFEM